MRKEIMYFQQKKDKSPASTAASEKQEQDQCDDE
jgi:hypothetical protein